MRLTADEIAAIRDCARSRFGEGATVRLFGSRTDDARRGGDIDLHIVAERDELATFAAELKFLGCLHDRIGERRIDLVLRGPSECDEPIDEIAKTRGIVLWPVRNC